MWVWGALEQDAQKDKILAELTKIVFDPRVCGHPSERSADPDKEFALKSEYAAYIALFL